MADDVDARSVVLERFSVDVDSYAELNAPLLAQAAQPMLDALDLSGADRILDLGAGTGLMLQSLRTQAPRAKVVGVDLAAPMLSRARRDTGAPVAVMDVTQLAVAEGVADIAVSAFVLRFLPDPAAALREQHRVLRSGGVAGVAVWGADRDAPHEALFDKVLDEHGAAPYTGGSVLTDEQLDDPAKLRAALRAAGFADARTWKGILAWTFTTQSYLDFAQRALDHFRQRLGTLDEQTRTRAIAAAAERLVAAGIATGEDQTSVVYGIGTA